MVKKRLAPRYYLARNLRALLDATNKSAPEAAKEAGIDRKTVTNWLNGKYEPRPEELDKLAAIWDLPGWQLLRDDFDVHQALNKQLQLLIEHFQQADESDRENILRIAEMAGRRRK